jgi:hypothetical protein
MADFDVDAVVEGVAAQVRKAIADAEARATEIIRAAEREAEGIRARAEAEARDQVEGARRALEELTARFGTGAATAAPPAPTPPPPSPSSAEPAAKPTSEAEPVPAAPAPEPPPTGTPVAEPAADDTQAARLVAMKMALDGATREAIEAELERSYTLPDRGALLDDVLARVGK